MARLTGFFLCTLIVVARCITYATCIVMRVQISGSILFQWFFTGLERLISFRTQAQAYNLILFQLFLFRLPLRVKHKVDCIWFFLNRKKELLMAQSSFILHVGSFVLFFVHQIWSLRLSDKLVKLLLVHFSWVSLFHSAQIMLVIAIFDLSWRLSLLELGLNFATLQSLRTAFFT